MKIDGKRMVLTGACGGLGRAVAQRLAERGARLLLVGRNDEVLQALCDGLPGGEHGVVVADLGSSAGVSAVVAVAGEAVDGLINCAGVNTFGLFSEQGSGELRQMLAVNVEAPAALIRGLLPVLREHNSVIVNVGSTFGAIGYPGFSAYCASKFALRGLTEALARELADTPVSVRYFAPRAIRTAMNSERVEAMNAELGNAMDPPEVVAEDLVRFVESDERRRDSGWPERLFVRINALLPRLVDKSLASTLPVITRYARRADAVVDAAREPAA
ncbi:SDR family oxidoreductase [Parahaliea aestuarii]|uniref:SDR family oxidoreductase n=1 Tax=Parahaliea aestuarii TaxID=1852021 RepID=A0A5C9A398_9GAMM|nr:SDR family oxidoreductase [Parahaliea aestuarii]TXS94549.1 SDR family oxidoreductase [Parahaliea aestuarii]